MKKIVIGTLILAILGLGTLSFKGSEMQIMSTEIEIATTPEEVYTILKDINKWQEWSPIINKSSGELAKGEKLEITMMGKTEGSDGPKYSPTITELEENKLIHWRAHMMAGFIFTNDKILELEATENGTKLTHKETFKGLLAPIFCGQMEKGVPPMLNSMNKALKELAEK